MTMKVLTLGLLLLVLVSPFVKGDELEPPPVDVYRTTLEDYVGAAHSNVEMKVYFAAYVDALELECDKLSLEVQKLLKGQGSQDLPKDFKKAHRAMKEYMDKMAAPYEFVAWWDFEAKEAFHGTGIGYRSMSFQASLLWRHIVAYNCLLQQRDGYAFDLETGLGSGQIGGYGKAEMCELAKSTAKHSRFIRSIGTNEKLHRQSID